MDMFNRYLHSYLRFVWNKSNGKKEVIRTNKNIREYLENDFTFNASKNWKTGFDIVDWLEGSGIMEQKYKAIYKCQVTDMFDFPRFCKMIHRIISFYKTKFGNVRIGKSSITPECVLRKFIEMASYDNKSDIDDAVYALNPYFYGIIDNIIDYYEIEYGDAYQFIHYITPEIVLRNIVFIFLKQISVDELLLILDIEMCQVCDCMQCNCNYITKDPYYYSL